MATCALAYYIAKHDVLNEQTENRRTDTQTCLRHIRSFTSSDCMTSCSKVDRSIRMRELLNLTFGRCKRRILYETSGNLKPTQNDAFFS